MNQGFEDKHPRKDAGKFAAKQAGDPGTDIITGTKPAFFVTFEFALNDRPTNRRLVDVSPILADLTPAEWRALKVGGYDLYADCLERGLLDMPNNTHDYVVSVRYTDEALDEWQSAVMELAEPDLDDEELDPTPAQHLARVADDTQVLIRHLLDPDAIPTTRDAVWAHADEVTNRLGDTMDTEGREQLWHAIVNHRNPAWAVGLTERYRLMREQPEH